MDDNLYCLKKLLKEEDFPYFSDEDLLFYLDLNEGDINSTVYQCALLKSENSAVSLDGISLSDNSSYFKRLASEYRASNSGVLGG